MPGIINIAKTSTVSMPQLSIKNQMKTQLQIGSEENLGKKILLGDSDGIFADWCKELNRKPKFDWFEKQPLNEVKSGDNIQKSSEKGFKSKHNRWLAEVSGRMWKLGF